MTSRRRPCYWLLADDRLDLGREAARLELFRAHFKHTILFHPQLVISDSYAVNNFNFRVSIRSDPHLQQLVNSQILFIAKREQDGQLCDLATVRDEMVAGKKTPVEFAESDYLSDDELSFLDRAAPTLSYSIGDVSHRYQTQVSKIFASELAREILANDPLFEVINEIIRERLANSEGVNYKFFHYREHQGAEGLGALVLRRMPALHWQAIEETIQQMANYPYITALPGELSIDAVYADRHSRAFDMLAGRAELGEAGPVYQFTSKFGLDSFVRGIGMLTADDILTLLDTDEARHVEAVTSDGKLDEIEIRNAVFSYQRRVEDQILLRASGLREAPGAGISIPLELSYLETAGVATYESFVDALFGFPGILGVLFKKPIVDVLRRVVGIDKDEQLRKRAAESQRREREYARQELLAELAGTESLESDTVITPGVETQYRKVT